MARVYVKACKARCLEVDMETEQDNTNFCLDHRCSYCQKDSRGHFGSGGYRSYYRGLGRCSHKGCIRLDSDVSGLHQPKSCHRQFVQHV